MDPPSIHSGGGRISCFLPMSPEASSPLPPHIHVHGTFGLNDDRRTLKWPGGERLKWPGGERRNDPTAEWNILLVKELLPPCYGLLLRYAKMLLTPAQFYGAWPDVDTVRSTPWKALLLPLFRILLGQPVLWTEKTEALQCVGEWLRPGEATFIPKGCKLPSVVHNALSSCNVKLVTIPDKIWKALAFSGTSVQEVSPSLARARLKLNPSSYSSIDSVGKLELLRYCLSDNTYRELPGLVLLPLTNGSFVAFESPSRYYQIYRYLCSSECPHHLLPNLDERLVDTSNDDDLHSSLLEVANSNFTQLQMLTVSTVAQLLPESMPAEWRGQQVVSLPHYSFPTDWFRKFWEWIQGKSLDTFRGQLVVPCSQSGQTSRIPSSFQVTRLNADSSTVYIPARATCSPTLMSALERLQVRCSKVSDFRYLNHWQITLYLNEFTPNGILDAIAHSGANLQWVSFTADEASTLRELLSQSRSYSHPRLQILQKLSIFVTAKNSSNNLYSVIQVKQTSCLRRAIKEPQNFIIEGRQLPSNLILFLRQEYNQIRLLQHFGSLVSSPDNTDFLLEFLFPLVQQRSIPDHLLDGLMQKVLDNLPYLMPQYHSSQSSERLKNSLQSLPFLKTATGTRKCPNELLDPADSQLSQLFEGESVFPIHPFNQPQYLTQLRRCSLRTTATPQEIVNIVNSIATPQATSYPQNVSSVRLSRAKAVLAYLSECDSLFMSTSVTLPHLRGWSTFSSALKYLATNRNWLPVSQSPPTDYPSCLSWKGSPYNSHLVSLNSSVSVLSNDSSSELPFVVGSQMYLVEPSLPSQVVSHCFPSGGIPAKHILAHFQEIIDNHQNIPSKQMDRITRLLYQMLLAHKQQGLQSQLKTLHKWIWLRRYQSFVSPSVVAVKQNITFRQNLEPFLIILPDDLTQYADLFKAFGVTERITQSQIMSVLGMIKDRASTELRAADAWQMVMSILNWLTNSGETDVELSYDTTLFVPTESESEYPELVEASEVVYTDNDFLKNYLASSDSEKNYIFVHHHIRPEMAHHLGLTPLGQHLEISEDTFEDVGQHEPLTIRLRNILQDYKDRVTIIKELLQNADDAGASVVNICYDSRTHGVPRKHLIYSGMAECHGPALVVHNDASFSDEDFKNITKLAAGTKQDDPLKIGKFGIGFCSVYHITDVPSFVSRDFLYIFDPNLKFLRQEIKDRARPGKKLRFTDTIVASSKQLVPYANLYNFNPKKPYNGTMFRLPFRTSPSDISHNIYNEDTIQGLLADVTKCGPKLLLFLRNVKQITFSRIDPGDNTPKLLLSITKADGATVSTDSRCLAQMCTTTLNSNAQVHKQHWLVSSHRETVMFRESEKYATASVVGLLETSGKPHSGYTPKCIEGEVFCFLPLAVHTGLPVHVSSNLAVMKDRTGIKSSDDTESSNESQWNAFLMQQVIPVAYHMLIMALQQMCAEGKIRSETYQFFSLWPLKHSLKSHNPWDDLIEPLYQLISLDNSKLFYSPYTTEWIPMKQCKFLAPTICKSYRESTPKCVLEVVKYLDLPVVNLPSSYQEHLPKEALLECTISEKDFIQRFFENIDSLKDCQTTRNEVLLHLLEMFTIATAEQKDYLKHHLSSSKCIPCTPDGNQLKECSKVIDKWSPFAGLYGPEDGVFPIKEFCVNELLRSFLRLLGINSDSLPWKMLAERARSVQFLHNIDKHEALKRTKLIIECIEKNLAALTSETVDPEANELAEIPFLPVMQKPSDYPLKWYGQDSDLLSGRELFRAIPENVFLVGSQTPLVSEAEPENGGCGFIPSRVQTYLQIQPSPTTEIVLKQLYHMTNIGKEPCHESRQSAMEYLSDWMAKGSSLVYEFLETKLSLSQCSAEELHHLQYTPCVWTGREFVSPAVVAVNWEHNGPYLFSVPQSLKQKRNLMAALGIQTDFSAEDLFGALEKMKYDFGSEIVSNSKHQTIVPVLVQQLAKAPELPKDFTCYLPDTSFIMHKAEELAYNDAPWCKLDKEWKLVHTSIPRDAALKLGIKPVRSRLLGMHESSKQHFEGVEFGQKERLTQRIKNILREYPFDVTVMKELLQNADDAKATKMYIILDKRTHRAKQLPSNEWKHLQGPALLVWNDSIFTEDDLSGIQRLGLGNKRSDAESIGLYGIGFNVVYHLTDCPSFITNGSTFCVLDPHCQYVPGANEQTPGRRYDNLDETFWSNWKDLRSAYLQNKFPGCPNELKGGTLFRFPLRSTKELVQLSNIVDESWVSSDQSSPLSAWKMQEKLKEWAPDMEKALLFLNHITELKFFTIIESRTESRMQLTHCSKVILDDDTKTSRALLHDKIKAFEDTNGEPHIVHYALTITKESSPSRRAESQRWLIQQGVGDVDNPDQHWKYSPQVKPRHGLAAPLEGHGSIGLRGSVFCFLPLPLVSNLPVHVNGSFMLNAARSNLWSSEKSDDRTKWNEKLIEAIASSYARFLVTARDFYVFKGSGSDQQLQRYYNNFPVWLINDKKQPQGLFKALAKEVYEKLSKQNAHILAMMIKSHPTKHFKVSPPIAEACVIEWHPLRNDTHPSKQAFFFWQTTIPRETTQASIQKADTQGETAQATTQKAKIPKETAQAAIQKAKIPKETAQAAIQKAKIPAQAVVQKAKIPKETAQAEIQKAKIPKETAQAATQKADTLEETVLATIFEKIGMHITAAPYRIRKHFKDIGIELHKISPSSVFQYYNNYFSNVHHFPCPIQTSAFQLVATFRKFTRYLLRKCEDSPGYYEFPESPFGIPLLLTADEQLQKFDELNKVLNSAFASLFPESAGMFLHPELLEMNYVPTYFIEPSESNWDLIHGILSSLLPPSLCSEGVDNANECIIRTATLELLWDCLANDSVFLQHLQQIVGKWAILPSTDNQLFSVKSQCQLLPIIPPRPGEECHQQVFDILKWFKVPELNTAVVPTRCERLYPERSEPASVLTTEPVEESLEENLRWNELPENTVFQAAVKCCEKICPVLSKPASVLTSLFCLSTQQKKDFLPSPRPDFDHKITVLFDYFSNIHFGVDKSSLRRIRSLPLFRNIDGELCSLQGKTVYVWPSNVCQDDCDKWVEKNTGAVFLKRGGAWSQLGPAEVLGVQEISPLTVYTEYIFPHFCLLDENQRLKHLQHIRDNLFDDAKRDSKSKHKCFIALQFVSALEKLPCLCHDGSLKPVSEFADHTVQVFTTFTEYFHFLPEKLSGEKWLKFFRKVGLHAKVTHDEFLRFCQQVSCGSHRDLALASTVLLSYLFDCGIKVTDKEAEKEAKKWYENKVFLRKVSQIPFVCTTTLPALSWIKSPYPAENPIQQGLDMTKLNGAVSSEVYYLLYNHYYLVWTVRSVVDLPTLPYFIFPNTSEAFYDALGIVRSPAIKDVIQNIKNISQTRFSSFSLFNKYPEECKFGDSPEMTSRLLVEVMKANFEFIFNSICPESTLKQLCDIPCVPVCARGQTRNIRCPVLVKPLQVIANTDEVEEFRPFLNPLPDNLYSVLPGVLSVIGVGQSIHLKNIRAALETIHASVTPLLLDPNTQTIVKRFLKKLYHILQSSMEKTTEILASLKPLYLPTAELTLVDSTVLFYCDKTQYKKARPPIDLTRTPCTLFSPLNLETGFNEKKFCELLPTEIRPCPLSSYCDEVQRYSVAQECSSLAKRLAYSFSLGHDFAEVTYALLRQSNPNEEKLCFRFAESLNKFLQTTEVTTVRNLVVDIMLNLTEPKQKIGTAKVDFLLEKNDNSFVLYLDEEANPFRLHTLIESLVATVAEMSGISSSELTELEKAISHPLEAENHEELIQILEDMDVPDIRALEFQPDSFDPNLKPQYGKPIPESWHHRLEQSINNIFRPGEWVGYEEREDHIVFARVGYRILQDGQSPEDIQLEDQYLIYTREDDDEGKTVSVIDLYKIIHSSGRDLSLATEKQPFDEGDLKTIKIQICEELRHIWKLPEDQQRKAIKRLYLKWHPDKNNHYLATKAFQFLQRQIARLHAGLPLEDPDSEEEECPPMPPPTWTHPWNSAARRHGRARQREQNFWTTSCRSPEEFDSEALTPDPQAAKVWIEQAEADLIALEVPLAQIDSERKLCSHVCFLAHEVAEKALKAAVYAACGLNPGYLKHHILSGLVGVLEQERRQQTFGLRKHVCALEGYYLYTRYPNQYFPPKVPADQYTPTQAREAKSDAQAIFDMMKTVVTVDEATSTYKHAEH